MIDECRLPPAFTTAIAAIAGSAAERDRHGEDLSIEIGLLSGCGALIGSLPGSMNASATWSDTPRALADLLRALGRASLPVGRLFEGHVNAAQLIGIYGSATLQERTVARVAKGALLGVWGADGDKPVRAERCGDGFRLSGAKSFCSGLGIVRTALVSATMEGGTQLFAVDVTDASRSNPASWRVSGMRATGSGDYDFSGMIVPAYAAVGSLNDYFVEPWFLGGMYRMCAVQVGGIEALLASIIAHIQRRRATGDAIQQMRIGQIAAQLLMARSVTDQLAGAIADGNDAEAIAQQAALTRDAVETCATNILVMVERSGGTAAHREGSDLDRIRRDLGLYLRQAAVDARLVQAGAQLLAGGKGESVNDRPIQRPRLVAGGTVERPNAQER